MEHEAAGIGERIYIVCVSNPVLCPSGYILSMAFKKRTHVHAQTDLHWWRWLWVRVDGLAGATALPAAAGRALLHGLADDVRVAPALGQAPGLVGSFHGR